MNVKKILIQGPNWLGDSVLAIPAMKAIREHFPVAAITLFVRPSVAGLFTTAPFLDSVWSEPRPASLSRWKRLARHIQEGGFDLSIVFPNSFESALIAFLGRVPMRVGYATDGRSLLLTKAVRPGDEPCHQIYYYLDLIKSFSPDIRKPSIEIRATPEEQEEARELLESEGIGRNESFLVLNPGAAYGSAKRWHQERFAETGDRLARLLGLRVVIIGSPLEAGVAAEVQARMKSPVAVLNGKTRLEALVGLLSESSLVITNDSGPMHVAAALGTPTVAVFGSTDHQATSPTGSRARVVRKPVECSPCLLRECPIDHRCMASVSVDDVCRVAQDLMAHE